MEELWLRCSRKLYEISWRAVTRAGCQPEQSKTAGALRPGPSPGMSNEMIP